MEINCDELRARLAAVPVEDLHAVHDLFLEVGKAVAVTGKSREGVELSVVARYADRRLGQAIRSAQARGLLCTNGLHPDGREPVTKYLTKSALPNVYAQTDEVPDELFERVIHNVRQQPAVRGRPAGWCGRDQVVDELRRLKQVGWTPVPAKVVPTKRGSRTMHHMAIQINAIAMGVQDLDPGEVNAEEFANMIEQVFQDIGEIRGFLRRVKKA